MKVYARARERQPSIHFLLAESLKKKVRKGLQLISEVLRMIVCDQDENLKDGRLLQFVRKRREVTYQIIEDWLVC